MQRWSRYPHDAVGRAFIEVAGAEDEIALDAPAGITVEWIHRAGADLVGDDLAGDNAPLVAAVRSAPWLPGRRRSSSTARPRRSCTTCARISEERRGVAAADVDFGLLAARADRGIFQAVEEGPGRRRSDQGRGSSGG